MSDPLPATATAPAVDLATLDRPELEALALAVAAELDRRNAPAGTVRVELSAAPPYDSRKNGHAYVARLVPLPGSKVDRKFIDGGDREWDTKRKTYSRDWSFDARPGDVLEARLSDGSWRNDYRSWFVVTADGLTEVSQAEARAALRKGVALG